MPRTLASASLIKMTTSHIIENKLQSGEQESDEVLMSEGMVQGSSSESCMYVPVNTKASVIDMLRGIIIQSGNGSRATNTWQAVKKPLLK